MAKLKKKTKSNHDPASQSVQTAGAATADGQVDVPRQLGKKKKKLKAKSTVSDTAAAVASPPLAEATKKKNRHAAEAAVPTAEVRGKKRKKKVSDTDDPFLVDTVGEATKEDSSQLAKQRKRKVEPMSWDNSTVEPRIWADPTPAPYRNPIRYPHNPLKVFVGSLPWGVTQKTVEQDFSACGEIERIDMPRNGSRINGCAWIHFSTQAGVAQALEYDGKNYHGRTLKVMVAKEQDAQAKEHADKGRGTDENTVVVRGLSYETSEERLTQEFTECGRVVAIRMVRNHDGGFKGVAFLVFNEPSGVKAALVYDGRDFDGRKISVKPVAPTGNDGKGKRGKGKCKGSGRGYHS